MDKTRIATTALLMLEDAKPLHYDSMLLLLVAIYYIRTGYVLSHLLFQYGLVDADVYFVVEHIKDLPHDEDSLTLMSMVAQLSWAKCECEEP